MAERREQKIFLSTLPASAEQRRVALLVLAIAAAAFVLVAPFARLHVAPIPAILPAAILPAYEAARLVTALITAGLLFALYAVDRSPAVLVLAAGYLFSALTVIPPYALAIAELFAPLGLFVNGSHMAAWLFDIWQLVWHVVFAFVVLAYALLKDGSSTLSPPDRGAAAAILGSVAIVTLGVVAIALFVVAGRSVLVPLMLGARGSEPIWRYATSAILALDLVALGVLWVRRQSLLDLWLIVVMGCLIFGISLSAVLSQTRFSLGYYAGRFYELMAASFVLVILLLEATALYARLARSVETERRERERRINEMQSVLFHLSRVNELAQIVSSLIHEVNQPLAAIGNYLAALQRLVQMGKAEVVGPTLEKAAAQAARASNIVHRLRDFVVKRETEKKLESLPQTIEDAIALATVGAGDQNLRVATQFDPKAAEAFVDRIQIEQVLFNLVRNAAEAMAASARRELSITTARLDEDRIEVRVADTGPGLPDSVRAKLFEPFVTTKASGMGVGLSVCRVIVEAHGGKLHVEDNPRGGTTFRFTIPASPVAAEEMTEARSSVIEVLSSPHGPPAAAGEAGEITNS